MLRDSVSQINDGGAKDRFSTKELGLESYQVLLAMKKELEEQNQREEHNLFEPEDTYKPILDFFRFEVIKIEFDDVSENLIKPLRNMLDNFYLEQEYGEIKRHTESILTIQKIRDAFSATVEFFRGNFIMKTFKYIGTAIIESIKEDIRAIVGVIGNTPRFIAEMIMGKDDDNFVDIKDILKEQNQILLKGQLSQTRTDWERIREDGLVKIFTRTTASLLTMGKFSRWTAQSAEDKRSRGEKPNSLFERMSAKYFKDIILKETSMNTLMAKTTDLQGKSHELFTQMLHRLEQIQYNIMYFVDRVFPGLQRNIYGDILFRKSTAAEQAKDMGAFSEDAKDSKSILTKMLGVFGGLKSLSVDSMKRLSSVYNTLITNIAAMRDNSIVGLSKQDQLISDITNNTDTIESVVTAATKQTEHLYNMEKALEESNLGKGGSGLGLFSGLFKKINFKGMGGLVKNLGRGLILAAGKGLMGLVGVAGKLLAAPFSKVLLAFFAGWSIGTAIYKAFDEQILDFIEAVHHTARDIKNVLVGMVEKFVGWIEEGIRTFLPDSVANAIFGEQESVDQTAQRTVDEMRMEQEKIKQEKIAEQARLNEQLANSPEMTQQMIEIMQKQYEGIRELTKKPVATVPLQPEKDTGTILGTFGVL